ncbi:DeoR/GlpR family DNA-binding transcription regulator [Sphingomonas sp.]|uniref:DeoR/GlpR family DNA-binding transcription regulator n=1 Tax=Sphingomonas sp. TaxID=28214 RepID=UPI0025E99158|nr:DeoR/GlpR family DNA-binding transcription regulator [Sphingomonas sp.]
MHGEERERLILDAIGERGFVTYQALQSRLSASPATIRRDLARLAEAGLIERVHGGARLVSGRPDGKGDAGLRLTGASFEQSLLDRIDQKRAIGKAAAGLCRANEGIMVDGGTTTFQMCPHLAGLGLQVLTNSLHIVSALLPQTGTQILVPSGSVFRDQNIILAPEGEESMPRFHAPRLFMGAAAIGPQGIMQADVLLVAGERRFIDRAEEIVICADSSKFTRSSGNVVCPLDDVDILVTDEGIGKDSVDMIEAAGIKLVIAV